MSGRERGHQEVDRVLASFIRVAVLSVSKPAGKLFIYPTFYEGGECDPNLVVTGALPNQSVDPMVPWLFKNVGKSIYVMGSDYIYPRGMAKKIQVDIEGLGGKYLGSEFYPFNTRDYSPLLQSAAAKKPDIIWVMDGSAPDTFVRQYREFDLKPQLVSTIMNENLAIPLKGAAEGELLNSSYFASLDTPANVSYIKKYRERFGNKIIPMSYAESAYAGVRLYANAVAKAGSVDNAKVVKALAEVDFEAPQGRVNIFARNQHMRCNSVVGRVRKDGMIDIVEKFGQIDPVTPGCKLS